MSKFTVPSTDDIERANEAYEKAAEVLAADGGAVRLAWVWLCGLLYGLLLGVVIGYSYQRCRYEETFRACSAYGCVVDGEWQRSR